MMTLADRRDDIAFNTMAFPSKLYAMLEDADSRGFESVISWQPGDKSFKVHQMAAFSKSIMPAYFAQTKFKSFQRQLNIYGWKKVQLGPNKGGYTHPSFLRGHPGLCDLIVRRKDSANNTRHFQPPQHETPSFLQFPPSALSPRPMKEGAVFVTTSGIKPQDHMCNLSEREVSLFYDFFYPKPDITDSLDDALAIDEGLFSVELPAEDLLLHQQHDILVSDASKPMVAKHGDDAELDGFISMLNAEHDGGDDESDGHAEDRACENDDETTHNEVVSSVDDKDLDASELSFPFKLHLMLENAKRDNYEHIVSWVNNGTAFKVHDNKAFVEQVMPNFFDQSKYESFRRQLNLYHFKRISKGEDRGIISHPYFLLGSRHLCKDIFRLRHLDLQQQQELFLGPQATTNTRIEI